MYSFNQRICSMNKKTLVIGASLKPERYSNKAIRLLRRFNHPVEAIGLKNGKVADVELKTGFPDLKSIHTVTLYLGPARQDVYYDYLKKLQPERVIFNPGTENNEFIEILRKQGIETVENCTLVMLNSGLY